ncbi:hypothetical protein PR048_014711, partial [Dryococelus australis]
MQGRGRRVTPEKTHRPAPSPGTIPTCDNPRTTPPGIETGSPRWEEDSLTTTPPQLLNIFAVDANSARIKGREKRESPKKTRRPAASSVTIPTCEDPGVTRAGIEPGSVGKTLLWRLYERTSSPPRRVEVTGANRSRYNMHTSRRSSLQPTGVICKPPSTYGSQGVKLRSANIQPTTGQHGPPDGVSSAIAVIAISLLQHKGPRRPGSPLCCIATIKRLAVAGWRSRDADVRQDPVLGRGEPFAVVNDHMESRTLADCMDRPRCLNGVKQSWYNSGVENLQKSPKSIGGI